MLKAYYCILATHDRMEYDISNAEFSIPDEIIEYLDLDEDTQLAKSDFDTPELKWVVQEVLVNTDEIELAYRYCSGVTRVEFKSTSSINVYTDFEEFKNEEFITNTRP